MIAWMATKIVMALDRNGVGAVSRVGGAVMGAAYAIGLLLTANVAYAISLPDADRLNFVPKVFSESATLQKSDKTAQSVYAFMDRSGLLKRLTSRELEENKEESTLND